jgi:hypothetical protein
MPLHFPRSLREDLIGYVANLAVITMSARAANQSTDANTAFRHHIAHSPTININQLAILRGSFFVDVTRPLVVP